MTRKRKLLFGCFLPTIAVFIVLALFSLVGFVQGPHRALGDRVIFILSGATRVETFRLNDTGEGDWLGSKEIRQFPLVGQGKTQGKAFAARMSGLVLDPRTYLGPNDSTCLFNPGVAYRAWRGSECVEVIVCFHCGQMLITTKDAGGHPVHTTDTDFLWRRAGFLALARGAFPGDEETQSLH